MGWVTTVLGFFVGLFQTIKILWEAYKQAAPTPSEKEDKAKKKVDEVEDKFDKDGRGGNLDV
jgi:hypothetical protein